MNDIILRLSDKKDAAQAVSPPPIGRLLVDKGKISQDDLHHALKLQARIDAPLGDILVSEGFIQNTDVRAALAVQGHTREIDLNHCPPEPSMAARIPAELCLKHGVVPWREEDDSFYVATSSPKAFDNLRHDLDDNGAALFPVIVDEAQIQQQQCNLYGAYLAEQAAFRVPAHESCRSWGLHQGKRMRWAAAVAGLLLAALFFAPYWLLTIAILWAALTLVMTTVLKVATLIAYLSPKRPDWITAWLAWLKRHLPHRQSQQVQSELTLLATDRADAALRMTDALRAFPGGLRSINTGDRRFRLPRVSMLVPLLNEREIATQLIDRLSQLTYPKSLLEVVLVLEENDTLTRETIARTALPDWMKVIEVPQAGGITTKPRALNYALDFCKGSIVGVWDAEDWPEADQIEKVVSRFNQAPSDVVCLQGVLDYYNSRSSWLARCFTIEYAMWWRIIMPGIARLGLVVPLGGTTLFFKRRALETLGGWDAHNVTEDADLGVRLARHGYKTELLPTVTREEATSRAWPWVRQRSRWLKGFLVTYFVHMRSPGALIRDLGFLRFMGLQTLFLASVSQFAAAPLLWSFWLTVFGLTHPVELTLGATFVVGLAVLFIASEAVSLTLGFVATSDRSRRHLMPYVPTMMIYFCLGALAAYKAVWELIRVPFYWDKTQHGVTVQTDPTPVPEPKRVQLSS
ncbi:MAG: glycosyltransferase [Roseobacter sp.]